MTNFNSIIQEINTNLPDNNTQSITAAKIRTTLIDFVNEVQSNSDEIQNTLEEQGTKANTALQPKQQGQYYEDNFVSFDANGGIKDSNCNENTFIKGVQQNGVDLQKDANGKVNVTVQNGENGLSAFEIAQQQGYTGTVDQWLASLKANIGEFLFVPTDAAAVLAMATIGQTYPSAIDTQGKNIAPTQNTLSIILLMNDDATTPTKTMMIATQEASTPDTYEFVYIGDLQSAMSSNVLTDDKIDNDFAGGSDKVAGAKEVKIIADNTLDLITGINILNPESIDTEHLVKYQDGTEYTIPSAVHDYVYGCTPYIELTDEGLVCNHVPARGGVGQVGACLYSSKDASGFLGYKEQRFGVDSIVVTKADNANCKYVRFNLIAGYDGDEYAVYRGTSLPPSFVPYSEEYAMKTQNSYFNSGEKVQDTDVVNDFTESNGTVADGRQINKLFDFPIVYPKNLLYESWEDGWINDQGVKAGGSAYKRCIVPCEPNTTYYLSVGSGIIGSTAPAVVMFGENGYGDFEGLVGYTNKSYLLIQTNANARYLGISAGDNADHLQLELGNERTTYEEPFTPYQSKKFKQAYMPDIIIPDGSITEQKLANGVLIEPKPQMFGVIKNKNISIAANGMLYTPFIECAKNVTLIANIKSQFTEVQVGVGYQGFYGYSFIITPTTIKMVHGTNETEVFAAESHGLTISDNTTLIVDKKVDSSEAFVILMDNDGGLYKKTITYPIYSGRPFLRNNGSSAISAELSFIPKDINQKIWLFGDSYFSYNDSARWVYYLVNNGFLSYLLIARGGGNASEAIQSLQTLIYTGSRPSYIGWFMGMNGADDAVDAPNATWLEKTETMLQICSQYKITPILVTIPTVPSHSHEHMNTWIRNSGVRYVDMAAAVEETGTTYWKNWGETNAMLSNDEVHPTQYGAKALFAKVMSEFQEIVTVN